MENARVADLFDEMADLTELAGGNEFRVRAYRAAAGTIRHLPQRLEDLRKRGDDLSEIPDIGEGSARKIHEILAKGTCDRLEELRAEVPPELPELMRVPGLGPKTVMRLHEQLGVTTAAELERACREQRVRQLDGMGAMSEAAILDGLEALARGGERILLLDAEGRVDTVGRQLDRADAVDRWVAAGSYRRRKETVGDLDVLVRASDRAAAADAIQAIDGVEEVLGRGHAGISVRLAGGLQLDVRFFEEREFGAALLYFTGSKAHNIALRERAVERTWKLNEYGLFKGERRLAGRSEEAVYHRLNLRWVPPELREDRGELDAARHDTLPDLVDHAHVRGDLHAHTDATDGRAGIRDMAEAARARGHAYLAITDHSKRVTMAHGLDDDAALAHADAVREVNEELDDIWLLAGIEVDILGGGALDLKRSTLEALDWVVASVHYDLDVGEEAMTQRYLSAVQSGVVHCLGHPTTRLLSQRDPVAFDTERVFEACAEHGVALEINAQPHRLDLPDALCQRARALGVRFAISTDAHRPTDLGFMRFGVDVARRGWLEPREVLNTRGAQQLRQLLGRT